MAGVTTIGATLLGPGEVRVLAGRVTIGAEPASPRLRYRLAVSPADGRHPRRDDPDLAPRRVGKLAVNCAINPLTALAGCPNGASWRTRPHRATLERRGPRGGSGGRRARDTPPEEAGEWALRSGPGRPRSNRSSMLQDVERGARTEIDALCGAVCREGRHRVRPHRR